MIKSVRKRNKTLSTYEYCAHLHIGPLERVDIQFSQHFAKCGRRPQADLSQHALIHR